MGEFGVRERGRDWPCQAVAWTGAALAYAGAQGLSAWIAMRTKGSDARSQYTEFTRPAFAPPGAVFPFAWTALNLTTATSAWLVWRARRAGCLQDRTPSRGPALTWWALAIAARSAYLPVAFGRRQFWAATADSAVLCAVMIRYAILARRVNPAACALAIPEVAWTAFATVLSAAVARANT
jgi:benzodiazapine receptor